MSDFIGILFPIFLFGFPIFATYVIVNGIAKLVKKYQSKIYTSSKIKKAILFLLLSIITIILICFFGFLALNILFSLPGATM